MKEAAELISGEQGPHVSRERLASVKFILRLVHFETRYLSIDEGLAASDLTNILEFSSGFSFRGLNHCENPNVHYVDTDLPQLMATKRPLVEQLAKIFCSYPVDNLIMQDLNVLDEDAFADALRMLPPGPVTIVNEGLLMYLDEAQKQTLGAIIHDQLSERGGCWITADIYLKKDETVDQTCGLFEDVGKEFLSEHHVEDNKFETFEAAEAFFSECGFTIRQKVEVPPDRVSSRKWLETLPRSSLGGLKGKKKNRETWILVPEG
jgi:O-methyltransferase involved in polyketide biosynthesis